MIRRLTSLFSLCVLGLGSSVCLAAEPKGKVTYDQHVLPLFKDKCLSCHNAEKSKGGLDLASYVKVMQGGASGAVLKPGDPDGSRLYKVVAHLEEPFMPPDSPVIAKDSLDIVRSWIQQGALENAGSKPAAIKPKMEVALNSIKRGKPDVVPMPTVPLRKDPVVSTSKANAVIALAASPWAPLVAVGGQKQILLYHGDTMELLGVLPFAPGTPTVLKFSRNGSLLVAGGGRGGHSGKVVLYNVQTGEQVIEVGNELDAVLAADISADQTQIALGSPNKMVRIYSTKDGSLLREMKKHTDWICTLEFSPDAVLLATGDRSGGLMVWEANTGREFYNLRGHTAGIVDVSWRDDSNVLASTSEDGTIKLWEMENGNNIKNWGAHGGGTQSVRFSHDNRLVSTGRDRITKIWDQNGTAQKTFPPHSDLALRAAINHDSTKVYSGDWTGAILTYAVADAKLVAQATTNPPKAAQQLEVATKNLVAKQAAFDQANAAIGPANAKVQQTAVELAPAQKLLAIVTDANNAAIASSAPLKAALDKASADLANATSKVQAGTVKSTALTEAYTKIKAASDANKANADLLAAANMAKTTADAAAAELAAAQKAMADAQAAVTAATAKYQPAATSIAEVQGALKLATDIATPKQAAAKAAADAVAPLKAALDKATAELTAAKAEVEKLKPPAPPVKK
jgi:WD40 repeat protein